MLPWESCVLWLGYPLQNGVWPDISKYDNDGVLIGAVWGGDSLEFDGVDDYVNCGYMGDFGSEMDSNKPTFEAWVKSPETSRAMRIMGMFNDGGTTGIVLSFNVNYTGGSNYPGHIRLYLRDENGITVDGAVNTNTGITDGGWHHIAAAWDGPNDNIYIYVDGILQTFTYRAQGSPSVFVNFQYPLYIGAANSRGATSSPFEGCIKRALLHNKILTADQIREAYEQTYKLI